MSSYNYNQNDNCDDTMLDSEIRSEINCFLRNPSSDKYTFNIEFSDAYLLRDIIKELRNYEGRFISYKINKIGCLNYDYAEITVYLVRPDGYDSDKYDC